MVCLVGCERGDLLGNIRISSMFAADYELKTAVGDFFYTRPVEFHTKDMRLSL